MQEGPGAEPLEALERLRHPRCRCAVHALVCQAADLRERRGLSAGRGEAPGAGVAASSTISDVDVPVTKAAPRDSVRLRRRSRVQATPPFSEAACLHLLVENAAVQSMYPMSDAPVG